MWIARIQMCDCTEQGGMGWDDYWQGVVSDDPGMLYVSDGDPNTITAPDDVNTEIFGDVDEARAEAAGQAVVRY
jgi:hypothetical protein